MSNILVQPQQLRQIAEQLRSHAQKIDQALHAIDNDIHSLKGHQFLGHRADQVQMHYAPKRDALLQAKQLVLRFAEELDQAASVFEQADRGGGPPSVGVPTPPIMPSPPVFPLPGPPSVTQAFILGESGIKPPWFKPGKPITMAIGMGEGGIFPKPGFPFPIPPTLAWGSENGVFPGLPVPVFPSPPGHTLGIGEDGEFPWMPIITFAMGNEHGHGDYPFPWTPLKPLPNLPQPFPLPGDGLVSKTWVPEFPEYRLFNLEDSIKTLTFDFGV